MRRRRGGAAGQTLRLYGERKRSDRLLVSFLFFLPAVWVSTTGHVHYELKSKVLKEIYARVLGRQL